MLLTAALSIAARDAQQATVALLMLGFSRFLSLTAILAIASRSLTFRNRHWLDRRYLLWLAPILAWCLASPFLFDPTMPYCQDISWRPRYSWRGGLTFLGVLRQARLLGIGVVGVALLLAAVTQVWIGVAMARSATGVLPVELMLVNGLLFLFVGLGLHLLVFEEMTCGLRIANRRLQESQAKLRGLAIADSLTGCYNRRFFHEVIGRELQRHERHDVLLAILFVDIDQFKMVNDTLGHDAGDWLLEYVALFLKGHVREADYVFRWGGDEFLMLLSCTLEEAREKGAELATAFRTALTTSGLPTGVGLSMG